MLFCPYCDRVLRRSTTNSILQFTCDVCLENFPPEPADTLISSKFVGSHDITDLLKYAAFDRVNKKVSIQCESCKIPFMTLVVTEKISYLTCTCGVQRKVSEVEQIIM